MAINAKTAPSNSGPRAPLLDVGSYPARLVQIIDLGVQKQRPWQGQEKPPARMINLTYELLDEFMLDEDEQEDTSRPRWLSERFVLHNLEADKAKSTLRYNALDPAGVYEGDFMKCLGIPVNITVVHNPNPKDKEYPYQNVGGITPMREKDAIKAPALVNGTVIFDLEEADIEKFLKLPQFIQKMIRENLEFPGSLMEKMIEMGEGAPPKAEEKENDEEEKPY